VSGELGQSSAAPPRNCNDDPSQLEGNKVSMTHKIAALVLLALLAGCSGGGATDQQSSSDPTVSTQVDPTPPPTPSGDFATAVKFTKLAHSNDLKGYREAAELTAPESPAARYVAHQALMVKAQKTADGRVEEGGEYRFKADHLKQTVRIKYEGGEAMGKPFAYTWRDFTYDQGKVTGWTGASNPIDKVLWTRETSGKSRGRKAVLKSAYLANSGALWVTAELSSSVGTGWGDPTYSARGGYRQTASGQGAQDISRGEKTLAYFMFEDAKFGDVMHLEYYDADGTSQGDWQLDLAVK
jgi:hypothetical protein